MMLTYSTRMRPLNLANWVDISPDELYHCSPPIWTQILINSATKLTYSSPMQLTLLKGGMRKNIILYFYGGI